MEVNVIGAGLAGSEAALQLAKSGFKVNLFEMRPIKTTGAHTTGDCAEFVCSNSLGSYDLTNASGLRFGVPDVPAPVFLRADEDIDFRRIFS